MRKTLGILLILALIAGIFVSCSQDKVGSMVDEDLVSVSFSSEGVSRALTVSRETFNENNYVWYYKSAKADSTGLKQGEKDTWTPVKPTTGTRTGLSGARITGLSQGLWDFELQAYVYNTGDAQDKDYVATGVAAWYGKVTNQSVRKDAANIVYVTVSAISGGTGTIDWHGISGMKELDQTTTLSFAQIIAAGMKVYVSATKVGATAAAAEFTINSTNIGTMTGLFTAVPYGTYLFNMKVFSGTDIASADYIYADETIAVNVYSGLKTIITGFISELSSYVEFGEPVANAVIEAETPNIATAPVTEDVVFTNKQTEESTSFSTAVIKADAADAIRTAVIQTVTEGNTLSDLSLALNVEDKGSTDATSGTTTTTTKSFDISLTQIVTVTNDSTGVSTVTSSDVQSVSKHLVIDLYVGAGLQNFKAYHNVGGVDKLMGEVSSEVLPAPGSEDYNAFGYFWYKSSSGVVTLFVDSFSPFSVTYDTKQSVARVIKPNGTGADYYSLQEAFDAAKDGDTVKLLRDIEIEANLSSGAYYEIRQSLDNLVLDGNNKTITANNTAEGGYLFMFCDDTKACQWTVKDMTIVSTGFQVAILTNSDVTTDTNRNVLYLDHVDVTCDGECVYANGFSNVIGNDCHFKHEGQYATGKDPVYYSGVITGYSGHVELTNCDVLSFGNAVCTFPSGGEIQLVNCSLSVNESTTTESNAGYVLWARNEDYKGEYVDYCQDSLIIVNNVTTKTVDGTLKITQGWKSKDSHLYARIMITGGNYENFIVEEDHNVDCDISGNNHIVITGGTFDHDPTAYVAEGYEAVEDEGLWTVSELPVVRIEGKADYDTFEAAAAAAVSGDKILVYKDCTASYHGDQAYNFSGKTITIHVGEGATLACGDVTNGKFVIGWNNAAGTLTLEGPGKITFNANSTWGLITQNGNADGNKTKAIVKNVTIEAISGNGSVMTGGNLTVESGYFKNIAFADGTTIEGGYFTTDVSTCNIPEGKMCVAYTGSGYSYFVTDLDETHANFSVLHNDEYSYYMTLEAASLAAKNSGDTLKFIGSDSVVALNQSTNQFWGLAGVTYDLNGHTIKGGSGYLINLFDLSSGQALTVKNGTIDVPAEYFCGVNDFTINVINAHFADALYDQVMTHVVSDGVFVKDQEGFFAIQKTIPGTYLAKIVRGGKSLYYTYAVSTNVQNGDSIYVQAYDANVKFKLTALDDIITVERVSTDVDFPIVEFVSGDAKETIVSDTVRTYKAAPGPVCQVGEKKYETLAAGLDAIKGGGEIKLLEDIEVLEPIIVGSAQGVTPAPTNGQILITNWTAAVQYTLDFNGHKINSAGDISSVFRIIGSNGGTFVFKDSVGTGGLIAGKNCYSGLFSVGNVKGKTGKVRFYSGIYDNGGSSTTGKIVHRLNITLTTEVYGGTFSKKPEVGTNNNFSTDAPAIVDGTWVYDSVTKYYVKQ